MRFWTATMFGQEYKFYYSEPSKYAPTKGSAILATNSWWFEVAPSEYFKPIRQTMYRDFSSQKLKQVIEKVGL